MVGGRGGIEGMVGCFCGMGDGAEGRGEMETGLG